MPADAAPVEPVGARWRPDRRVAETCRVARLGDTVRCRAAVGRPRLGRYSRLMLLRAALRIGSAR